jgi:microcystin-dependent protein
MAISFDAKKNFAYSVVATAPSPAASGTSLVVATGDGTKFPATPFNAVVWPTGVQPTTANAEIVRVTNKATDTLTITRAQEGTAARTILVNDQIAVNITAKTLTDIEAAFATASQLGSPIGSIKMWLTGTMPTGWLLLNGQTVSRTTYAALFALWGTTFGAGDGSTTFGLPDFRQRIPIGLTASAPLNTLGATSGSWDHTHGPGTLRVANHTHGPGTLAVASHSHGAGTLQVASHTHGPGTLQVASHNHTAGTLSASSDGSHTHTGSTSTNGSHTHGIGVADTELSGDQDAFNVLAEETDPSGDHSHTFTTDSGGSHTHAISGETATQNPTVDSGTTASTAPAVSSGSTGAAAPAVTSGESAGQNPFVDSGVTAAANPPVIVVNFMVRASLEI